MAVSAVLRRFLGQTALDLTRFAAPVSCQIQQSRDYWKPINKPKPGVQGKSYRRIVHFKDQYTVEPLEVTNLAGRDPVTGNSFSCFIFPFFCDERLCAFLVNCCKALSFVHKAKFGLCYCSMCVVACNVISV